MGQIGSFRPIVPKRCCLILTWRYRHLLKEQMTLHSFFDPRLLTIKHREARWDLAKRGLTFCPPRPASPVCPPPSALEAPGRPVSAPCPSALPEPSGPRPPSSSGAGARPALSYSQAASAMPERVRLFHSRRTYPVLLLVGLLYNLCPHTPIVPPPRLLLPVCK